MNTHPYAYLEVDLENEQKYLYFKEFEKQQETNKETNSIIVIDINESILDQEEK